MRHQTQRRRGELYDDDPKSRRSRVVPRYHFRHADEKGGLWYIEAVPDRGELVAIKQAELTSAGRLHRYSWEHLEDEHGGLTDQAIDPEEDLLEIIPTEEFQRVWTQ
ncbi:hypothetical protein GCM10010469_15380 [Streptomyces labedae]|uniref:Uncharacterized protein n=1 Tax=Streptomyces labedae TaxID=285569 RepID=A0ABP6QVJ3_9ACTN